jgi:ABC-type uncharacterized transport system involved in gliding motility auxiliary subunit
MAKKSSSKKKFNIRQYAWIGLVISGVALLVAGLGLVAKLLVYIKFFSLPNAKPLDTTLWISLGLIIIGPALFALLDPQKVRLFLTGRQARHGSNAAITMIAFVGILLVINILVYQNPVQWDWTSDKQHTLAPETLDTLNALPGPVKAYGFFTANTSSTTAQSLLTDYKNKSNGKFDFQIIDPNNNPGLATKYGITTDGSIVFTMENRQEIITYATEQEATNALVRLMNPGTRAVYFLTGHGERDIQNTSDTKSVTKLRTTLESKNYTVKTLNLVAQNSIPADALAIIIAGPTVAISDAEMTLLDKYVTNGGSLVVLEQPSILNSASTAPDLLLNYLATTWGITLNNDIVIDTNTSQPLYAVANAYGQHAITDKLQNKITFYPMARSLSLAQVANGVPTGLVQTLSNAWGETDFAALQSNKVSFDASTDFPGPLTLAAAAQANSGKGRVVVFGDTDFASDNYFAQAANGDMIVNAIDWASQQDNMISLTAKTATQRQLPPPGNAVMILLGFSFICLIPGLVVGGGVAAWLMRRSRG